jgi:cytochrome c5
MTRFCFLLGVMLFSMLLSSCAYEKADELAPKVVCTPPAVVSYSQSISPIFDRNCRSCHNPVLLTGNVNLEDFSVVKQYINNGMLMGNVKHLPGYNAMPLNADKLSDCDIQLLQKWVDAGAPNN